MAIADRVDSAIFGGVNFHARKFKRLFDIVFAVFAIASLSIVFVLVAIAVKLSSPGPVFFSHERIGSGGRPFRCLKFRTMHLGAQESIDALLADPELAAEYQSKRKLTNDPRVIPIVGTFLRRSSLDEIPQFINVLMGDMSVVGPRPVTEEELPLYGRHVEEYLATRPGITGAWQVSGRSELCFQERVDLDVDYVSNWSFAKDLKIIARTVFVIFPGRGAC